MVGKTLLSQGPDARAEWVPLEESLLCMDNLHGQTKDKFKAYLAKECNTLLWLYPGGCTDEVQEIDVGHGSLMKWEVGQRLDMWLGNGDILDRWEGNAVTASGRRVLLTKWVATAVDNIDKRASYRFRLLEKTCVAMTVDGTGDERITL